MGEILRRIDQGPSRKTFRALWVSPHTAWGKIILKNFILQETWEITKSDKYAIHGSELVNRRRGTILHNRHLELVVVYNWRD